MGWLFKRKIVIPMTYSGYRDLIVFQKSYKLALEIYQVTRLFPKEELYSLTDQIRRSSRSIVVNIAEAWAKRIYEKAFVNKITDALGEELETEVWLDMATDMDYLENSSYLNLKTKYDEIRKMRISILNNPGKFCK